MYDDDGDTLREIERVAAAAADRGDTAVEALCDDALAGDADPGAVLEARTQILINLFDAVSAAGVDLQLRELDSPGASKALVTWATARGVFVFAGFSLTRVKLQSGREISVIGKQA